MKFCLSRATSKTWDIAILKGHDSAKIVEGKWVSAGTLEFHDNV